MSFEFVIEVGEKHNATLHFACHSPEVIFFRGSDGELTTIDIDHAELVVEAIRDMLSLARSHTVNRSIKKRKAKRSGMIGD